MSVVQIVLITAAVFVVPGTIFSWVSGLKLPWALASSIPVSFGTFGLAAWLLGQVDIRFDLTSYLLIFFCFVVLAGLWRLGFLLVDRRRQIRQQTPATAEPTEVSTSALKTHQRQGGILDPAWLLPAAGVVTGMALFLTKGMEFLGRTPGQLENIVQGWDVHWHASMVRWIMEEGIADPTRMGELRNLEDQTALYYPSGWHTGAFLAGDLANLSPIAAINVVSIVLPGIALPLSVAMIAWKMVGGKGLTAQLAAGIAAIAVVASPVLMWIGSYVGAWPYLAAIAVSGTVLALFMHVPYRPVAVFSAAVSFMGLVQLHPAAVTIVLMGLALWWLFYLVWVPASSSRAIGSSAVSATGKKILARVRDIGWLALAGLIGAGVLLPQLLSGSEETEDVSAYTAFEDISRGEAWRTSLFMETRHTDAFPDFDPTLVLWLAAIGAVALVVWRRNLWAPAFYGLSLWITANSLTPVGQPWAEWLDIIGSLHYSTAHRLVMPVALFTFAAAGVGVAVIIRLISLAPVKQWTPWTTIISVSLGLLAGWGTVRWVDTDEVMEGAEWSINAPRIDNRMVSSVDLRAFDWLAQQPGAFDGLIMGEPADGHGWMYAYNGLPSVMRHYTWPSRTEAGFVNMLYWHPPLLGVGNHGDPEQSNDVDYAAAEMGVKFYFVSPGSFWGFQEPPWQMLDGLWGTPGVTPIYLDKNVSIFAVNQEFSDAELSRMRAPGNSPEDLPPLVLNGDGEPAFHRPSKPDLGPAAPAGPVEESATRP